MAAIQHFSVGIYFSVEMDHRALSFLQSAKHLNACLTRWALQLQNYNFTIQYHPGSCNKNADALSRLVEWDTSSSDDGVRHLMGGGEMLCHGQHEHYKHDEDY